MSSDRKWDLHLTKDDDKYTCKECGRVYNTDKSFETHLRSKHRMSTPDYLVKYDVVSSENYIKCLICGEYCRDLNMHIRHNHRDTTNEEYISKYNYKGIWISKVTKSIKSEQMQGDKNISHSLNLSIEERRKRSHFCIEFYQERYPELSDKEHQEMADEATGKNKRRVR